MIWLISMIACNSQIDNKPSAEVREATQTKVQKEPSNPAKKLPVKKATKQEGALSLDASSKVEWVGAKITMDHTGGFKTISGSAVVKEGKLQSINAEIDITSLFSDSANLTKHLLNKKKQMQKESLIKLKVILTLQLKVVRYQQEHHLSL